VRSSAGHRELASEGASHLGHGRPSILSQIHFCRRLAGNKKYDNVARDTAWEDSMSELVRLAVTAGIASIRLNRPDRLNALDAALAHALLEALARVDAEPSVRVVTLTAEGRAFMAGGDISVFHDAPDDAAAEAAKLIALFHQIVRLIRRMKPTVIAGLQGAVAGGGLSLALACDLVIAAGNAALVPAYTRIGTSPDGGMTWSVTQLIGQRRALEWLTLGDPLGAAEAAALGLINRVVPTDTLQDEVMALAQRIANGPPLAFASVKRLVHQAATNSFDEQLEAERESFIAAARTRDFREGVAAFFARREPKFGE
jgi:2-(1,2-epoxy-1,2-dihydrophenyl)acetyl-CoA isomerase